MSLRMKKAIVLAALVSVLLLSNVWLVAGWLDKLGVIAVADRLRTEYLTGTAIAVIVTMLFLLGGDGAIRACGRLVRRCPVCDHPMLRPGKYCGECGSRM